jgi:diguanylate cyclase (GGDEF)-like protein/PAS domain S-box-containing protein
MSVRKRKEYAAMTTRSMTMLNNPTYRNKIASAVAKVENMGGEAKMHLRRRQDEALYQEKERYRVTLASIGEAVITTDIRRCITFMNPIAEKITGFAQSDALGLKLEKVLQATDEHSRAPLEDLVQACLRGDTSLSPEHTLVVLDDGEKSIIDAALSPIKNSQSEAIGAVISFRDVTEKREMTRKLAHQAMHDSLTGLVNREEFERRLKRVFDERVPHDEHALLYLDLDQFKIVNDSCGHMAGDEMLKQIAQLLQTCLRKRDTLARLGGDEFGALLEHCTPELAVRIAEKMRRAVHAFRFLWEEHQFGVGVSIGVVPITDTSDSIQEIMKAADSACYLAKDQGRNRVQLFKTNDSDLARRHGEMRWIPHIQRALAENRFRLDIEPIVAVSNPQSRIAHGEVLVRMLDKAGEVVPPGAFIPAAERYDQMVAVDKWVIGHALNLITTCPKQNSPDLLSINISAQSLSDGSFLEYVLDALGEADLASRLCFEITETAAITNYRHALEFITQLRKRGCRFALDDFGSGLSSFSYLKTLHVDFLKIDGRFIAGMLGDAVDAAVVNAIHQIAHVMNIKTIAEYVENARTVDRLKAVGVDYAQGSYFGAPRSLETLCAAQR